MNNVNQWEMLKWADENGKAILADHSSAADEVVIALGLFTVYKDDEHFERLKTARDNWEKSRESSRVS